MNIGEFVYRDIVARNLRQYQADVNKRFQEWEVHAHNLAQDRNKYLSLYEKYLSLYENRDARLKKALAAFQECRTLYHASYAEAEKLKKDLEKLEDENYEQYIELKKAEDSYNRVLFDRTNLQSERDEHIKRIKDLENQVSALQDEVKKYKPDAKWDF